MPIYNGTDGNDVLAGTDGDDIFYWSKGQDVFVGGAGYDKAIIDYSTIAGTQGVGQYISYDSSSNGLYGSFRAWDGLTSVETRGVEELDVKTGSQNDSFYVDLTQVPAGWKLTLDAGAGSDYLTLNLYNGDPGLVGTVVGGTLISGNLILKNFEQFDLDLGVGNDQLTLGSGNDTVEADSGDDYIDGAGGDDVIEGGWGADTLIGGDGNDTLHSMSGYGYDYQLEHDVLNGGAGNDHISVGWGDDADGGTGTDKLSLELRYGTGGVTLDLATLFSGGTIVVGGATIKGFEGYDTIYATEFDDTIIVGNTNNVAVPLASGIQTFGGNDTITAGTGGDVVNAGSGNDVIHSGGGDDRISGDGDNDQVFGEAGNDMLWGGDGNDQAYGGDGSDTILGGNGADQIHGDIGDDILNGEAGDDFVYGGAGNDTLTGEWGADHLEGGANDDIYNIDEFDTVVEAAGGGVDEIRTSLESYSLANIANVENLTGTGFYAQTLIGNDSANRIDGGMGADRMEGGIGNDTYVIDDIGDIAFEGASAGVDTVISSASGYALLGLASNVENLTIADHANAGASGNALANVMTGNALNNWLQSGGGTDTLNGLGGDDFLDGGEGADTVNGGDGSDWIIGGAGNDVLTGGALGDVFYFGSALNANVDQITDFAIGDVIFLDTNIFASLAAGALAATAFRSGSAATNSSHRIIYNSSTGQISYDADGNGAGAAIQFARVTPGTALTAASFYIGTDGPYAMEASISYLLASNEQDLVLTGTASIDGAGNELNNSITGNSGSNWLTGSAGVDLLTGGAGNDVFHDSAAGLNGDTITDFAAGDTIVISDANLAGFTFNLTGNTLTYTGGSLTLQGTFAYEMVASAAAGGGVELKLNAPPPPPPSEHEFLTGTEQYDEIHAGAGNDTVSGLAGNDILYGETGNDTLNGDAGNDWLYGGEDNDILNGGTGADWMEGGTGDDTYVIDHYGDAAVENDASGTDTVQSSITYAIYNNLENLTLTGTEAINGTGNAVANILIGNGQANSLSGLGGSDILSGAGGNDWLTGGEGDDSFQDTAAGLNGDTITDFVVGDQIIITDATLAGFSYSQTGNTLTYTGGTLTLQGSTGTLVASAAQGGGVKLTLQAAPTEGDDVLTGTEGPDEIHGLGGNDTIHGLGADDSLHGDNGNDTLNGGQGNDHLEGGFGNDALNGGADNDELLGQVGDDTLAGDAGNDTLEGGDGLDTLFGGEGNDTLDGGHWTDNLYGGAGDDLLIGAYFAGPSPDFEDDDLLDGGEGIDTVSYAAAQGSVIVDLSLTTAQETEAAGTDTFINIENVIGSSDGDLITGNSAANVLDGGDGDDTLLGGAGNDSLLGGAGTDLLRGSEGDDWLNGGDGLDTASYFGAVAGVSVNLGLAGAQNTVGAGIDTLIGIENLNGSLFNDQLIGDSGNNLLRGNSGHDTINGGDGNDTIEGGDDDDTLTDGAGSDTVNGGSGWDTIHASVGAGNDIYDGGTGGFSPEHDLVDYGSALAGVVVDLTLASDQARSAGGADAAGIGVDQLVNIEDVWGSGFDDTLTGNSGRNFLTGRAGNDTLSGGDSSDVLNGGDGNDILDGGNGTDRASYSGAVNGVTVSLAIAGVQDTGQGLDTLASIENLTGSQFDDVLTGNEVANFIFGNGGADEIYGGGGDDQLFDGAYIEGGVGNDVLSGIGASELYGGEGDDELNAGDGDSYLDGGSGADDLFGLTGNDTLLGGDGNDALNGYSGNDLLDGGAGADYMNGMDGDDTYIVDDAGDFVSETPNFGDDTVVSSISYSLTSNPISSEVIENLILTGNADLSGTGNSRDNFLVGNLGSNTLAGLGGNDILEGGGGNDTLDGGTGFDTATYAGAASGVTVSLAQFGGQNTGGAGTDTLIDIENLTGSAFNDTLTGNAATNIIDGGFGNDTIDGGDGYDMALYASAASGVTVNLALFGGQNTGGAGIDTLVDIEDLRGSSFGDTLTGNAATNVIQGGAGNDIIDGGAGADLMFGGLGDDRFYVDDAADQLVEAAGQGDDWAFVLGTYTLAQGVSVETLVALNQSSTDPLVLTGNEFGQSLYGNLGDNYLNGGQGADYLVGLAGNDNLLGGTGADNMQGGTGNDVYYADEAGDRIFESAGEGSDIVVATASFTLNDGAEVETLSADPNAGNIALTGNEFGQSLYGNGGNNVLTGLGGSDYLVGGAGNDVYYVDTSDFIGEEVGGGDDTIVVATSYTLRESNEIETLVALNQDSTDPVNLTGNEHGQSLYGSQGVNNLNGGAGNDYLVGLGGNDFLIGGEGNDHLAGGQGNDLYYVDGGDLITEAQGEGDDLVVASQSFALGAGASVETLSAAEGSAAINLTGNAFAQSLYGNAGDNVLTSGGGADYMVGGAGTDMFVLANAPGVATIGDYAAGEVVDIGQILSVANGTDVVAGGYVRVTGGGQLQVDVNGGGDAWTTIANVSGTSAVTIRYLAGGSASDLAVSRSAGQAGAALAAAAAGMAVILPAKPGEAGSEALPASDGISQPIAFQGFAVLDEAEALPAAAIGPVAGAKPVEPAVQAVRAPVQDAAASPLGDRPAGAPAEVLAPSEPAAHFAIGEAAPPGALGIALPSAEQLLALTAGQLDAGRPRSADDVEQLLADVLEDGPAAMDALLTGLPAAEETRLDISLAGIAEGWPGQPLDMPTVQPFHTAFAIDPFGLVAHTDVPLMT